MPNDKVKKITPYTKNDVNHHFCLKKLLLRLFVLEKLQIPR